MSFEELNLIEPILKALKQQGYSEPTPIQSQAIPPLLTGRDLLGCAQTGTGKTAAFAIPIIQHLSQNKTIARGRKAIKALILTPTRELAAQIENSFTDYGAFSGLRHTAIFGGVSQNKQVQILSRGVDILVATPGRLIDLINQKFVDLSQISYFVLDEADRMLDMGFLRDVERIIEQLPSERQTMLFSATMPAEIEKLTKKILTDPVKVAVTPVSSTVDAIDQSVYFVDKQNKTSLLIHLLKSADIYSALVFTRTKHSANQLAAKLEAAGETCDVIHSNKSQLARQQALARFKSGKSRVLVATDIVARGIDIVELSHVVNYDLPEVPEDYVHRIGRTARAGMRGTAISFCSHLEKKHLVNIEKLTGKNIRVIAEHPYPLVSFDDAPRVKSHEFRPRTQERRSSNANTSSNHQKSRYHSDRKDRPRSGSGTR